MTHPAEALNALSYIFQSRVIQREEKKKKEAIGTNWCLQPIQIVYQRYSQFPCHSVIGNQIMILVIGDRALKC